MRFLVEPPKQAWTHSEGQKSLFVFFQGHPEYESDTLLREYRRDIGRYLRSEAENYPLLPRNYFDARDRGRPECPAGRCDSKTGRGICAGSGRGVGVDQDHEFVETTAALLYKNWLETICARKNEEVVQSHAHVA